MSPGLSLLFEHQKPGLRILQNTLEPGQTTTTAPRLPWLFWVPALATALLCLFAWADTRGFTESVHQLNNEMFDLFGGFYLTFVFITLIAFLALGCSPLGKIRLGGADALPEHSYASWFAMLFCAGMGTGFMFWGAAEPLYHQMNPPLANITDPLEQTILALRYTFFHWGLSPWAVYGMTALALGFYGFNLKRGFNFSAFLFPDNPSQHPLRARIVNGLRGGIDLITILAIIFGISATIGMGTLHIEGGLKIILGIPPSKLLEGSILAVVAAAYLASTLNGLERGIKVLSNANLWLSIILLAALFFLGPMQAIVEALTTAIPAYIVTLPQMSFGVGEYLDPRWVGYWTVKYWSWWLAWAPFVGLFIAFISKGRTVRELVLATMIAPTLFSCLWFTVFGVTAIDAQLQGNLFGAQLNLDNVNEILYRLLDYLTPEPWLLWLSLALVAINFINSADSATYTIAALSAQDQDQDMTRHPGNGLQLAWGILFAILAGLLIFTGGIGILQEITLITVLPFTGLLVIMFTLLIRQMTIYYRSSQPLKND